MWTKRLKVVGVSLLTGVASAALLWGLVQVSKSPLFTIQDVEVLNVNARSPVDASTILGMAQIPVGRANLIHYELTPIKNRLLMHPWIKGVTLIKRFPQTLAISVEFREPMAIEQLGDGSLMFVDGEGEVFANASPAFGFDLPVLSGFESKGAPTIREALEIVKNWEKGRTPLTPKIATLGWEQDRGYRVVVSYRVMEKGGPVNARSLVELGPDAPRDIIQQMDRLNRVFSHLKEHGVNVRQIWADSEKKIVVKTARGS